MYFYSYYFLSLFSSGSRGKLTYLILLNLFVSINFSQIFESLSGFNNFFYLFTFKVLNVISSIDTNILFLVGCSIYLIYVNYKVIVLYIPLLTLLLFSDLPFYKNILIFGSIFSAPNLNLLNGLFLIHPLLLILLLIYLVRWVFSYLNSFRSLFVKDVIFKEKVCYKNILNTEFLIMSLMLVITGGWWAQQELNWGGWWAWDFVELANLNIVLLALLLRHLPKLPISVKINNKFTIFFAFFSVFAIYVYTRYNLIPSVHSFLSDLSFLQYDYLINNFLFLCLFTTLYMYYKNSFERTSCITNIHYTNYIYIMFLTLLSVFILLILNFSLLKTISVVLVKFFQNISIIFIFVYIILKVKDSFIMWFLIVFNPTVTILSQLVLNYGKFWRVMARLHYLFFLFVFLIVYSWGCSDLLFYNNVNSSSVSLEYFWVKFNNFFIITFKSISQNSQDVYNNSQKVVDSYFFNFSNSTSSLFCFDPIYVDNYTISNPNTLVSVNRTLFISYYFYYLFPLYSILTLYLFFLIKMF